MAFRVGLAGYNDTLCSLLHVYGQVAKLKTVDQRWMVLGASFGYLFKVSVTEYQQNLFDDSSRPDMSQ